MKISHYPGTQRVATYEGLRMSNWHVHFRRDFMLYAVAKHILRHVRYALAMPNTGPIATIEQALDYRAAILGAAGITDHKIDLIMTLYFTAYLTPAVVERIKEIERDLGIRIEVKYYPPEPGATTGSGQGGIPLSQGHEALLEMERLGVPLLLHAESVTDKDGQELPDEERERYMIKEVMWRFRDRYPRLRHCIEHASTIEAVKYVQGDTSLRTFMTVTPQHSLFIGDDFHELGTDLKCKPIVKSAEDRDFLVDFIVTGDQRAGAGDDGAPHPHKKKLGPFGDAANGCWTPHAFELYAEVFDRRGALGPPFESFTARNGAEWRNLPLPDENDTIRIVRKPHAIPDPVPIPGSDDEIASLGWSPTGPKFELSFTIEG